MGERKSVKRDLLPYSVILAATKGDFDAIDAVKSYYEGYIYTLSTRWLYDEYGTPHLCVDEGLRRRLENKLTAAILNFDAT
jgi:hypothetical protein